MRKRLFQKLFTMGVLILLFAVTITTDTWSHEFRSDVIRRYSRPYEFDYVQWEITTILEKVIDLSFGAAHHLNNNQQRRVVEDYFHLLSRSRDLEQQINELYSAPNQDETEIERQNLEQDLEHINTALRYKTKLAETVFQYQISHAIAELGITNVNTPAPPTLFHTTSLPKQLIISPRDAIRQERSISLIADIPLSEMIALEDAIEENSDFSALVVPIGGVGTYPTMIIQTTYLPNLIDTAAHEWIHNHLTFRPLGMLYDTTSALRTMNETTANIAGNEIMQKVFELYYPEYTQTYRTNSGNLNISANNAPLSQDEPFNFSREMFITRNQVDELLAEGKIDEAEAYMEERRQFLWENGYQIRKINQAYFSFYGAYADSPFSAAGSNPVGEDVRIFRSQQPDLRSFIWKISWMYNYRQLRTAARAF